MLFESGKATGKVNLTQVTVGLALGGQSYSELILFEDKSTLDTFKRSQFSMAAQVSAVAASAGASANAKYVSGVQVYTITKGGLMYEASVGGQKFTFTPWQTARERRLRPASSSHNASGTRRPTRANASLGRAYF